MSLSHPLLSRRPATEGPSLQLLQGAPDLRLAQGRVHEACGAARRTLAVWLAARTTGPVLWVAPRWSKERLNSDGLSPWIDPARLIHIYPQRPEDILWTMEEILRAGAVALAVADLPALPGLTQVRRMHLAAETGAREGQHAPLGLLLTPGEGGAAGVETRWHLSARHDQGQDAWRLERLRARTAPRQAWDVEQPGASTTPCLKIP
jgi:protein ImuA